MKKIRKRHFFMLLVVMLVTALALPAFAGTQKGKNGSGRAYYSFALAADKKSARQIWNDKAYPNGAVYQASVKIKNGMVYLSVKGRIKKAGSIKGLNSKKGLQKNKTTTFKINSKTKYYGWDDGNRFKLSKNYCYKMLRERWNLGVRLDVKNGVVESVNFFS